MLALEKTSVVRVAHVLLLCLITGNVEVNTLASKHSELIGNAAIVRKRCVIHKKLTCVCLHLPVDAIYAETQKRKVDLWPALDMYNKLQETLFYAGLHVQSYFLEQFTLYGHCPVWDFLIWFHCSLRFLVKFWIGSSTSPRNTEERLESSQRQHGEMDSSLRGHKRNAKCLEMQLADTLKDKKK